MAFLVVREDEVASCLGWERHIRSLADLPPNWWNKFENCSGTRHAQPAWVYDGGGIVVLDELPAAKPHF